MMEIETKNASLDTLAVTILALHVSGKQMTLAVFRQLPEGKETEQSELWGTVRYTIKDSGELWVVFSNEGRLFRRALNIKSPRRDEWAIREAQKDVNRQQDKINRYKNSGFYDNELAIAESTLANLQHELQTSIKEADDLYKEDTDRFNYETKLSQLRQLFISV